MALGDFLLNFWHIEPNVTDHDARVHIAICTALSGVVEDFPIRFPEGFVFPEPIEATFRRFYEQQGATYTEESDGMFDLWQAHFPDGRVYLVNATYFIHDRLLLVTVTENEI